MRRTIVTTPTHSREDGTRGAGTVAIIVCTMTSYDDEWALIEDACHLYDVVVHTLGSAQDIYTINVVTMIIFSGGRVVYPAGSLISEHLIYDFAVFLSRGALRTSLANLQRLAILFPVYGEESSASLGVVNPKIVGWFWDPDTTVDLLYLRLQRFECSLRAQWTSFVAPQPMYRCQKCKRVWELIQVIATDSRAYHCNTKDCKGVIQKEVLDERSSRSAHKANLQMFNDQTACIHRTLAAWRQNKVRIVSVSADSKSDSGDAGQGRLCACASCAICTNRTHRPPSSCTRPLPPLPWDNLQNNGNS